LHEIEYKSFKNACNYFSNSEEEAKKNPIQIKNVIIKIKKENPKQEVKQMPEGASENREKEIREIAYILKDAEFGKSPANLLFVGKPGTGKTTIAKYLLNQLKEVSSKPFDIYINCWETSTRFGILNKIITELGGMMPRRGIAADEVLARISEFIKKEENIVIVILDEIDRLLANGEEGVLYDLARAKELFGIKISLIGITNLENFASNLDLRIASSIIHYSIKFEPYTSIELKQILKERAKLALWQSAYNDDVIGLCAAIAAKAGGDARFAIHLLWASAKKAEDENRQKILIDDVYSSRDKSLAYAKTPLARKVQNLDEFDKTIISTIVESDEGVSSGKIYQKLNASPSEQRTIRNRLERLEKEGLVISKEITFNSGGKTRIWKVKTD
ncbi:MAG: Cdc6/Cdc18 family protein, partial [Candidatus Anstonellaceae archaeon]